MRLTKDHICEQRGSNIYFFDLDRMTFGESLKSMKDPDLIDLISVSFEKMYALENRNRMLKKLPPLKASYVSHGFKNNELIVIVKWEVQQ